MKVLERQRIDPAVVTLERHKISKRMFGEEVDRFSHGFRASVCVDGGSKVGGEGEKMAEMRRHALGGASPINTTSAFSFSHDSKEALFIFMGVL